MSNSELTTVMKEHQVLEVMAHIYAGLTQAQACKIVGIAPNTYRRYVQDNPGTVDAVRDMILLTEKSTLSEIVAARHVLVTRMIEKASTANDIPEIIAVNKHLGDMQKDLEGRVGVNAKSDDLAEDWLGNPDFKPVESRFVPVDTVNVKPKKDGSVDIKLTRKEAEIIDITPEDIDEEDDA